MTFFLLCGKMEGWSLLLQKSPCLMEARMDGWMERGFEGKKRGIGRKEKLREFKGLG